MNMESVSRSVSKMYNSLPTALGFQKNVNVVKQEATMGVVAFRLHPGDDLRESLLAIITQYYAMDAAVVLTCVGNLRKCRLKMAPRMAAAGSVPPSPMAKAGGSPFARPGAPTDSGAPSVSGEQQADAAGTNGDGETPTGGEGGDHAWAQRTGAHGVNGAGGPMPLHSPPSSHTRAQGGLDVFYREEVFEIVSLVGTLSGGDQGDCNLNIALADRCGARAHKRRARARPFPRPRGG